MPIEECANWVSASLKSHPNTSVQIRHFGATIVDWTCNGVARLFLSSKAIYDGKKAIRGGIPLVFPIFGPDPKEALPQHGFARITNWRFTGACEASENEVQMQFTMSHLDVGAHFTSVWPYPFTLVYTVILTTNKLMTQLAVKNEGKEAFHFNTLFHTYFKVPSIEDVTIPALNGLDYYDTLTKVNQDADTQPLKIKKETDRVYKKVSHCFVTLFPVNIHLVSNLPHLVLWHPWKNNNISDLVESEHMVCLEAGHVVNPIVLDAGMEYTAMQMLQCE